MASTDSIPKPKATKPLSKAKTRAQVDAWLIEGIPHPEIARRVGVQRVAIWRYAKKHEARLAPVVAEIERQITDAAIASKVNRILDADADYRRLGEVIEARANDTRYDEPGYRTGVLVHQLKQIGSGRNAETVDEYKTDTALIAERRALRREVAEALDALPRAGITFNDNRKQVLVRYVEGEHGLIEGEAVRYIVEGQA